MKNNIFTISSFNNRIYFWRLCSYCNLSQFANQICSIAVFKTISNSKLHVPNHAQFRGLFSYIIQIFICMFLVSFSYQSSIIISDFLAFFTGICFLTFIEFLFMIFTMLEALLITILVVLSLSILKSFNTFSIKI